MKSSVFTILVFCILPLAISCNKDYEYLLKTDEVTEQTDPVAVLSGEIITDNLSGITEFGFKWSTSEDFSITESISITEGIINGINSIKAENTFLFGITYYLKAFIIADNKTIYGNIVSFTGMSTPDVLITGFTPATGTWRDSITIQGKNFKDEINPIQFLNLDNEQIPFREVNDSVLKVAVPDELTSSESLFSLYTRFDTIKSSVSFKLLPPEISDFTPHYGERGTSIVINGKNFHPVNDYNSIKVGSYSLNILSSEVNKLTSVIPQTMTIEGSFDVTVKSGNQNTISGNGYIHIEPWSPNGEGQLTVEHGTGHKEMYFMIGSKCYYGYFNHFESRLGKCSNSISEINPVDRSSTSVVWYLDYEQSNISIFVDNSNIYLIRGSTISEVNQAGHHLNPKASFPDPTVTISGLTILNHGFIKTSNNQLWQYQPSTDTWIQKQNVPNGTLIKRMNIDNYCYTMFRLPDNSLDFYRYDILNDQWNLLDHYTNNDEQMNEVVSGSWLGHNSSGYSLLNYYKSGILQQYIYTFNPVANTWHKRIGPYNVNIPTGGLIYSNSNILYAKYWTWLDGSTLKFYYWKYDLTKTIP